MPILRSRHWRPMAPSLQMDARRSRKAPHYRGGDSLRKCSGSTPPHFGPGRPRRAMNACLAKQALASLTRREQETLHWLCECKTDREIGEILGISVHTVSKHLQRVFAKLGVENRM